MRPRVLGFVAAVLTPVGIAAAQQCGSGGPILPTVVPGAIVGLVTDTVNAPLEGIRIMIASPRRDVRTDRNGRFFIDSMAPGTYTVSLRRVGYDPAAAEITVRPEGGSARICMGVEPRALAPMVTSIFRGGLAGFIGDTALKGVQDVEVRAMAQTLYTRTDSTGSFFLDLKPGSYVIIAHKKGYARQIVSVTIPKDSGRQIAVWLNPADGKENRRAMEFEALRGRLLSATEFRFKLLTREALAATSFDLVGDLSAAAMRPILPDCQVAVGGEPGVTIPLWSIDKAEVDMFEVPRGSAVSARGPKSINSRGTSGAVRSAAPARSSAAGTCGGLVVWLRP